MNVLKRIQKRLSFWPENLGRQYSLLVNHIGFRGRKKLVKGFSRRFCSRWKDNRSNVIFNLLLIRPT